MVCISHEIKEDGMGGACSTCGGEEECMQCTGRETWNKEESYVIGMDEMKILKWILGNRMGSCDLRFVA
jgi:hypothetical protein